MNRSVAGLVVLVLQIGAAQCFAAHIPIDFPGASSTRASGISGTNIVGTYESASGTTHGFLYDGSTFTTINYPGASKTTANGVAGTNIVGTYWDASGTAHGFFYDGTAFTRIDYPGASETAANGFSNYDSDMVGSYKDASSQEHGFLHYATSFNTIDYPGASSTQAKGNTGELLVGTYTDASDTAHGFSFDGSYETVDYPGASSTRANGVEYRVIPPGGTIYTRFIVGTYTDASDNAHGFSFSSYDHAFASIDIPGATSTSANDTDGINIVGTYEDGTGTHGFLLAIPEPSTFSLLCVAALSVFWRRKK